MAKTAAIAVRVSDRTKEALERFAKSDRRTVANAVEVLLEEALKARGMLDDDPNEVRF